MSLQARIRMELPFTPVSDSLPTVNSSIYEDFSGSCETFLGALGNATSS
jgi:hypothetical protein